MIEPDYDIIIDQTDNRSFLGGRDDMYFHDSQKDESSVEEADAEFKIEFGRELIKLYTLICDSQNPIQSFILNYKSEIVDGENIMLFIDFGLTNGYIKKSLQHNSTSKASSFRYKG